MKLFLGAGAKKVANAIIICVQEERSEIIVVTWWTVKAFEITRSINCWAAYF